MPWMIVTEGNKHCVHKKNDDGTAGESLKCYDGDTAKADASKYLKALYAEADHAEAGSRFKELEGESLDARLNAVRSAFYDKYQNRSTGTIATDSYCWIKEVYDGYVIVEKGNELYKAKYTTDEGKVSFGDKSEWKPVKVNYVELQAGFLFVELSKVSGAHKNIDGLAAGSFRAMNGENVTFEKDELEKYIENTNEIIESTRTESGEIVGLPIDKDAHDHKGGAGWIKSLELDKVRNIIKFGVEWTKEGSKIISEGTRRFFSPSTHPGTKSILGGSLTNWPATRDKKGKYILRPIELSAELKEIHMENENPTVEELQAQLATANDSLTASQSRVAELEQVVAENVPADLTPEELEAFMNDAGPDVDELSRIAQQRAAVMVQAEKRKQHVMEFATKLIGGTKEKPFGLPIKPQRIIKLLLSLPKAQAAEVEWMLSTIYHNAIDFAEHGINGELNFSNKQKLPAEYREALGVWLETKENTVDGWFKAMGSDLAGDMDDFDLREFAKKED